MDELRLTRVPTNGITLHVAQSGAPDRPLVILLHGFPEFWYGWKKHLQPISSAGYLVWAPDQRGYNLSDKPTRVRDYTIELLSRDVLGLMDAAGRERAIVVGHDWGGAVAWWIATNYPERLQKLVIINVPHPVVMRRLLLTSPTQLFKSWYMFLLQIPALPEWGARVNNWGSVVDVMRKSSLPGTFSDGDFEEYRRAWSQPGAYRAMLAWYRAMFRHGLPTRRHTRIETPTLLLWGQQDKFIGVSGAEKSRELCDQVELVLFPENTHWLQHERAAEISERIIAFSSS